MYAMTAKIKVTLWSTRGQISASERQRILWSCSLLMDLDVAREAPWSIAHLENPAPGLSLAVDLLSWLMSLDTTWVQTTTMLNMKHLQSKTGTSTMVTYYQTRKRGLLWRKIFHELKDMQILNYTQYHLLLLVELRELVPSSIQK